MEYQLYKAPQTQESLSIPILLLDGTSSMNREYKYILQAYEQEFGDLQETQRRQYQWSQDLHDIYPFLNEARGNMTTVFAQLFQFMLTTQFPSQYVTIILVSDGREPYDINPLMELCQLIKSRYSVQFLCIAFGNQFPINIIQSLKQNIENQDFKNNSYFQITRSDHQCYLTIQQELKLAFQQIRKQLMITPQHHQLNFDVYTSISRKSTQQWVASNELFLAQSDKEIIIENQQLRKSDDPNLILLFLRKSIENIFHNEDLLQISEIVDEFNSIFKLSHKLIIGIKQTEENFQQLEHIQLILKVLEKIATSNPEEKTLDQYIQQFKIRIKSHNPENLKELLDKPKINNFDDFSKQFQLEMERSFQNLFILSSQNQPKISCDSLQEYWQIFDSCFVKFCELLEIIQESKIPEFQMLVTTFIKLTGEVFSSKNFNISTIEQFKLLININQQFVKLNQLKTETNISKLRNLINQEIDFQIINKMVPYSQLNELPFKFKKNDELLSEKYLIFLIDKNDALRAYSESLQKQYLEIFQKIPQKKRLEINWYSNEQSNFKIVSNQEFEKLQYQSFKELLDFLQDKLKLKNKYIQLLILTDNEQNYEKLHLQIRFAQLSHYTFKIIFITIGIKFQAYLENQISNISQSLQNVNLFIKNIPKQQYFAQDQNNKTHNDEQSRKNHNKILQEIANHIDIGNF